LAGVEVACTVAGEWT